MLKRRFSTLSAATAGTLVVALGCLAMAAVNAQAAPPLLYVNGSVKPLISVCPHEETECLSTEKKTYRSAYEPIIAWGPIVLHSPDIGSQGVSCTNTFTGRTYNAHEGEVLTAPERAYGTAEGWGTAQCTAPELLSKDETADHIHNLTVFASAERPLEIVNRQAEFCSETEVRLGHKKLEECTGPESRETESLAISIKRRTVSLPWKIELVHGYNKSHEEVVQQRIGMASFGECGPGAAEGTPTCSAAAETGHCYQANVEEATFANVPAGCVDTDIIIPQIPSEVPFFGALEVAARNGAGSGVSPSKIEFEEAFSGKLQSQINEFGAGTVAGKVKELGEEGQALVTSK